MHLPHPLVQHRYIRRAVDRLTESAVDGSSRFARRGRHQMRVDTQGETRVAVPEEVGQGPHVNAGGEQHARIGVPQRVIAVLARRRVLLPRHALRDDVGGHDRRLPEEGVEVVPVDRLPLA
jgi:hypothetical protein